MKRLPIVGISMGDPGGIGPEICAKALAAPEIYSLCRPLVVGDARVIADAVRFSGLDLKTAPCRRVSEARFARGTIDVFDLENLPLEKLRHKQVTAEQGKASFEYVAKVIELARAGEIDATVTGPINKEAINLAGHRFSGHTEIYAHYTGTRDYAMMLVHGDFRVVHVSTHVSLREACERVKKDRVLKVIGLAAAACRAIGIAAPRVGVAGLNPHAGENGLFGWEEEREIAPAVAEARKMGILAEGPFPPDSLFARAVGLFDVVVAMYHDQGHIPLKMVGFRWNKETKDWDSICGVNITLGLPIIRTSVDHGTAFDKAGRGIASAESMVHAIEYAAKLARCRSEV